MSATTGSEQRLPTEPIIDEVSWQLALTGVTVPPTAGLHMSSYWRDGR